MTRRLHASAFTLIEVAASSVVIGIMFIAVLSLIGDAREGQLDNRDRLIAADLASTLMAELAGLGFADPSSPAPALGVESGEVNDDRRTWDDVDDAAGYKQSQPLDPSGKALTLLQGLEATRWSWAVEVTYVDSANPSVAVAVPTPTKLVTVTVSRGSMVLATLTSIRTQGGS